MPTTLLKADAEPKTVRRFNLWHAFAPTGDMGDAVFRLVLGFCALLLVMILAVMIGSIFYKSLPSIHKFGFGFLSSSSWNPVRGVFGAAPFIYGTVVSSIIALIISIPLSIGIAVFLVEQAPKKIAQPISFMVELLAAIPSVVLGLWGIFVLAPLIREYIGPFLNKSLGWLPLFQGNITGTGLLTGGLILAIMVTPIISSVIRDVLSVVPVSQREAALALGATKWETTLVVLANGGPGIAGAIILGLGRAIGETMAVTMVIGNRAEISSSLFEPSYTIASVIANEFTEATDVLYLSSLIELGLILFLVTFIINGFARALVWSVTRRTGGVASA
ncbi:MAG: phosphate ABC transporter permease subunit PstC [Pyrinomonadaceae bacterium]